MSSIPAIQRRARQKPQYNQDADVKFYWRDSESNRCDKRQWKPGLGEHVAETCRKRRDCADSREAVPKRLIPNPTRASVYAIIKSERASSLESITKL